MIMKGNGWIASALAAALLLPAGIGMAAGTPGAATAATIQSSPDPTLLAAADIFKDLADSRGDIPPAQFSLAMARFQAQRPAIDAALAPMMRGQLSNLIAALQAAWARKNRTDVSLYCIETYRFLFDAAQRGDAGPARGMALSGIRAR